MDLNTIRAVLRPTARADLPAPHAGDAFLAGGTWLFSEPQRELARLIDLQALGWPPVTAGHDGLALAATCTLAELDAHAAEAPWAAAPLIRRCCRALWGSFKIWNAATVGGNMCLALPAAPMVAMAAALDGRCTIWCPDGSSRDVAASDFVLGPRHTCLAPGEVLRRIDLPAAALEARHALRQASLSTEGRSAALLIGSAQADGLVLTVTASTPRPLRLAFASMPDEPTLLHALDAQGAAIGWFDDEHGAPDWRRHMTLRLAAEIRGELAR
jgi:CO/xanthine dehydrogenase FAD-binding subunit